VQRWNDLGDVPTDLGRSVVTIGNFDGVHLGHQRVLTALVALARQRAAPAVAITFDPHPIAVLYPERAPAQIDGLTDRLARLAECGLDAVLVMIFTRELASWSPRRFVEEVLVGALHVGAVVVGHDTRFGHRNSGDISTLRELGAEHSFEVVAVEDLGSAAPAGPQIAANGRSGTERWSSTWVRSLLADGEVHTAAEVLGRPHRVSGVVVHGDHRGRELGYPTANLAADAEGMVPADGVYAGWVTVPGSDQARLPAAISVGTNPTFDGHIRRVEAYVLDRDDLEWYGVRIGVDFVRRLRPTIRFDGVEPLVAQMRRDVDLCREVLGVAGAPA
jgi:riboflavin kinase/FMN adenylyltransferase